MADGEKTADNMMADGNHAMGDRVAADGMMADAMTACESHPDGTVGEAMTMLGS